MEVQAYDPLKKCETAPVLRQLNVESAAKRRDFRFAERQRLQSLDHVATSRKAAQSTEREMVNICFFFDNKTNLFVCL